MHSILGQGSISGQDILGQGSISGQDILGGSISGQDI